MSYSNSNNTNPSRSTNPNNIYSSGHNTSTNNETITVGQRSTMSSNNNSSSNNAARPQPPIPRRLTSEDMDVEDAEAAAFHSVEAKHGTAPFAGTDLSEVKLFRAISGVTNDEAIALPASVVEDEDGHLSAASVPPPKKKLNLKLNLKNAVERVKRENRLKAQMALAAVHNKKRNNNGKDSSSGVRHLLAGIKEGDNEDASSGGGGGSERDGLMKHDRDNFYATDYDRHLLKADSDTDSTGSYEGINSSQQTGDATVQMGSHYQQPYPPGPPVGLHHRTQSAPMGGFNFLGMGHRRNASNVSSTNNSAMSPGGESTVSSLPMYHPASAPPHADQHQFQPQNHHHPESDYRNMATTAGGGHGQDAFMDVVVNADPSFAASQGSTHPLRQSYNQQQQFGAGGPTPSFKKKHLFPRWLREVGAMCHPARVADNAHDILVQSFVMWLGFPCLAASVFLFYIMGNPTMDFLPGEATLAWWLLFATRQTVTLGLARMTVYVCVDGFMLGTRLAVQTLGPLLTLIAATGKGWPLILASWGVWNLLILHGDNRFQTNWFYWTQLDFFNQHYNDGSIVLNGSLYTRVLWSMVLGGLAVSTKRTILALRFGRKQFAEFKPKLERILADVVLLSEIATLAEEAGKVEVIDEKEEPAPKWDLMAVTKGRPSLKDFFTTAASGETSTGEEHLENESTNSVEVEDNVTSHNEDRRASFAAKPMGEYDAAPASTDTCRTTLLSHHQLHKSASGRFRMKDMLDPWEVPDQKGEKTYADVSIHEILKFRRALAHLDQGDLFGESFGKTTDRDQCIASSQAVYAKLLTLSPDKEAEDGGRNGSVLDFDVLELLALEGDGVTVNLSKKRMLRKMFIPDRSGGLPQLAFVQACDKVYKRLRFFRASIRNATVIDSVLEKLVNIVFYFILVLTLSSLMRLNPWTLLMSMTSLLVSVSFALGSSISKYVEGILLIAVRRPYDLGDRIFMSGAETINPSPDVTSNSWFVEDITLTTTTLRYAKTNEVSTVNNWSIAGSRIVNCARSTSATVHFQFFAHTCILEGSKMEQFQSAVKQYVDERPRVWEKVGHIRHDLFDAPNERIDFVLALRHRSSWQEAGRIKLDRSDVFRFLFDLGNRLGVHNDPPVAQRVTYQGGALKRGDTDDCYMKDLMKGSNMKYD